MVCQPVLVENMMIKRSAISYLFIPFCYLMLSACGGGDTPSVDETPVDDNQTHEEK